jgi:hypothetical protein
MEYDNFYRIKGEDVNLWNVYVENLRRSHVRINKEWCIVVKIKPYVFI